MGTDHEAPAHDASPAPSPAPPAKAPGAQGPSSAPAPERVGHFRIVGRLGQGGMGVVYRAVDEKLHRDVAVKLLAGGVGDGDDRRKRFEREARAVAALSHPNIVSVHAVDQIDGQAFLVMEFIDGVTISDVIPPGGMALERLLDVAVPLVSAVAAAHEHGIVHRDLKPQNVMLNAAGTLKVLDFGLAKLAEGPGGPGAHAATMTGDGRILGTPAYMSPEQAESKPVDARSDVFSLGVMLYEMAVGELPFKGDSPMSTITSLLRDEPPPLDTRRPGLPLELWRVVRRCLAKEPGRRYQSTRDLLNDLEELRDEMSALAPTEPPPGPAQPGRARRGMAVTLAAALALGGIAAAGILVGSRVAARAAAQTRGAAGPPRAAAFTRLTRMTATSSMKGSASIAPDGKWFAFTTRVGASWQVFRQRTGGANATNLTAGSDESNSEPAISPDGETIAFRSERSEGGIFLMGATGESVRRLSDFGYAPAWSPDGKRLVVSTADVDEPMSRLTHGELWTIDVATGAKQRIVTGEDSTLPAFSPDGRLLAYHYWDSFLERGIAVVDAAGGKPTHLFRGLALWRPAWSPDGRHVYFAQIRMGDSNVWRAPFDAATRTFGELEPVTSGVGFELSDPSLSQDGRRLLVSAVHVTANLGRMRFDAARARVGPLEMLTRGSNRFGDIEVSPDGKWIAFASGGYGLRASTQEDILIARADGSELRKLTDDAPYDRVPRWTHDGKRIVFYSQRGDVTAAGTWSIGRDGVRAWSIAPDGSGLSRVYGGPGDHVLTLSPSPIDSRASAVLWDRALMLDLSRPAEQAAVAELPRVRPGARFYPCSWSADGATLYGSDVEDESGAPTGTYALTVATGEYRRVGPPDEWVLPLADGRHLLFTYQDALRVLDMKDGSSRVLFDPSPDPVGDFSLSHDEKWIYLSVISLDGDVWLLEPE